VLFLQAAGEERGFELVELAGDVVVAVELAVEHLREDLFGEDVLDQHLAHIGGREAGVDRFLRVLQELRRGLGERGIGRVLALDHRAQRFQHRGQVGLELRHGLAEVLDLGTLEAEKQFDQLFERMRVGHVATHHLFAVLDQHGPGTVFEDDVVLRVAALELVFDLGVEDVFGILGLPVAEGHAQLMQQRAVDEARVFRRAVELVLGDEDQVVLLAPALEQVLERLAHHRFAVRAADLLQHVELGEVLVDQDLAHALPASASGHRAGK
jgi:hypothetical protein